jgi:hypothetical protein
MRQSMWAVGVLLMMVAVFVAIFAWIDDRPTTTTWILRIVSLIGVAVILGGLVALDRRRDLAPDFLAQKVGDYFDRDGFCFAVTAGVHNNVCYFDLWFQNRFERRCRGRVALH